MLEMVKRVLRVIILCVDTLIFFFFFKQKTAYEIKECDWSSDVCSSDLVRGTSLFDGNYG